MGNIASQQYLELVLMLLLFQVEVFLFSQLSDHGEAERKRHDLAIEHLQQAEINGILNDRKDSIILTND